MKNDIVARLMAAGLMEDPAVAWPVAYFDGGGAAGGDGGGAGDGVGDSGPGGSSGESGAAAGGAGPAGPGGGDAGDSGSVGGDSGSVGGGPNDYGFASPGRSQRLRYLKSGTASDKPLTQADIDRVAQQILGQGTSGQWSGQGFGSAQANAADMARILASIGISDIRQFGQLPQYEELDTSNTYNGQYAYRDANGVWSYLPAPTVDRAGNPVQPPPQIVPDNGRGIQTLYGYDVDGKFTPVDQSKVKFDGGVPITPTGASVYGNKATGQVVPNTYSERQTGNAWGGTFAGSGNTGYRVQFTPDGMPVFYTTGASSNDLANLLGDNKLLNIAANVAAATFGGPAGVAALQLAQGRDIEDALKAAALTYVGGEVASGVSGSGAVVDALGQTGANIAGNAAAALATGQDPLQALVSGGLGAGVNAVLGQIPGYSGLSPTQQKMVYNTVAAKLAGKDPTEALVKSAISAGLNEIKTSMADTPGGIQNRVVDDTVAQGGVEQGLADAGLITDSGQFADSGSLSNEDLLQITGKDDGSYTGVNLAGPGEGVAPGIFVPSWLSLGADERVIGTGTDDEGTKTYTVQRVNPNNPDQFIEYSVDRDPVTGTVWYGQDRGDASPNGSVEIIASRKKPTVDWDAEGEPGSGQPAEPAEQPKAGQTGQDATALDDATLDFLTKPQTPTDPTLDELLGTAPTGTPPVEPPTPVKPPAANVTPTQVEQIVNDAIKANPTLTAEDVQKAVADSAQSQSMATTQAIADAKKALADEIQAAKDIGLQGDAALQAGLDSVSTKMGVNQADLLTQLGESTTTLRNEFSTGLANVEAAQKTESDARATQGQGLQDAISGVAGQVTGLEGKLTAQGKAFADQLVSQGMDYRTALQTAIDAQTAVFGTQIGDVQAQLAAAEAARQADVAAQLAREEAAKQSSAQAAKQANIQNIQNQGRQGLRSVADQLQAVQASEMIQQPTKVVEAGPGFDISDTLNTGFFSGFQSKKEQQNQPQTTKIASGGYIDDLLAENITADDLLNLLR